MRRSKAGGEPVKARRREMPRLRRCAVSKTAKIHAATADSDIEVAPLRRKLDELAEQQRATAQILGLIKNTTADLLPVFASILESAVRLCDGHTGVINRWDGEALHLIAAYEMPAAYIELRRQSPARRFEHSASGRMLATNAAIQIADLAADQAYLERDPPTVAAVELGGVRAALAVPMFKDRELVGSITLGRREARPFTERQIELARNFANQAVIAIENARLLAELRKRTDQLGRTVAELRRERNNKLMSLEAMVAALSHEVRQPLASIAANGSAALRFLGHVPPNLEEVRTALNRMVGDSHRASGVFDNIRALFAKADRSHEPIDISELIRSLLDGLNEELSEHGISIGAELPPNLPLVAGHKGQLQEVFTNLVRNAIDAMCSDIESPRVLKVSAQRQGANKVTVVVEDSGPGIDPEQRGNIFDAFVTTKSQGLGLGLALSKMIVERHSGQISAMPAQPRGMLFRVVLPAGRLHPK